MGVKHAGAKLLSATVALIIEMKICKLNYVHDHVRLSFKTLRPASVCLPPSPSSTGRGTKKRKMCSVGEGDHITARRKE